MAAHLFPILLDARPQWLRGEGPAVSLLGLPAGSGSLGQLLCAQALGDSDETVRVMPGFEPWEGYEETLGSGAANPLELLSPATWRAFVAQCEPSDWLLLVDPRFVPRETLDVAHLLPDGGAGCWQVKNLVVLRRSDGGTREYALLDDHGQVERIQRYYDGITHLQARGVACALVPVTAARRLPVRRFASVMEVRVALNGQGIPANDVPMRVGAIDVSTPAGLLELNERLLTATDVPGPSGDLHDRAWSGGRAVRASVHPSAVLSGPVILHDGVTIEAHSHIIGPTVIGAGATVGHNSIVAQCVVAPRVTLRPESIARQRVVIDGRPRPTPPPEIDAGGDDGRLRVLATPRHEEQPPAEMSRRLYAPVKRVMDFVVAAVGLAVLSPLLALTAVLVKLTSPGPVFFAHAREGLGGRVFHCLKFRTMVADADRRQREMYAQNQVDGPQFKITRDPRVTPIGRWLRLSNIDELPQLFNVLVGHMSLIGPRPSPFRENQICVPWRKARLSVRPGITGLWQICRHARHAADFHQWIHYDTLYVRHYSAWIDFKILVATVLSLGGRKPVPLEWIIPWRKLRSWGPPLLSHTGLPIPGASGAREPDEAGVPSGVGDAAR